MDTRFSLLKKVAFLFLLGTVVLALQTNVLAYWGENSSSIASSYDCQMHILPAVESGGMEYWYGFDVWNCRGGDWEACSEDGWLHLDLAWGCNADCAWNGGSQWHGNYEQEGFCDGQCRCSQG